jgi:hypothetical protein
MNERFGYCADCTNKGCCDRCYRGSYYETNNEKED